MWSNLIVALTVLVVVLYGLLGCLAFWMRSRLRQLSVIAHNLEFSAMRASRPDDVEVVDVG